MKKKILISTGGSGGHVVPAEILADHLRNEYEIFLSTDLRGYKFIKKDKDRIHIFDTPKLNFDYLILFKFIKVVFLIFKSYFFLKRNRINKVVSTGGYMSLPICISAKLLKLEIYLYEPNFALGRANKFFLKFCKAIICNTEKLINFPEKLKNKTRLIPFLVKKKFYEIKKLENENEKFCLLVAGGSQGAEVFENIIHRVIINLSKNFKIKIIQQTRSKNITYLKNIYEKANIENTIFDFEENFVNLISISDFCITRAGASTLAELSMMNKPFLAIPLQSSKDNHQFKNASFYENLNCCWIMSQRDLNINSLENFLRNLLKNKSEYNVKKDNLKKLNSQNSWNDVNQKILNIINEN